MRKNLFAVFLCVGLLLFAVSVNANLLTNGDFETGDLTGWYNHDVSVINTGDPYYNVAILNDDSSSGFATLSQPFFIDSGIDTVRISFDYFFVEEDSTPRYTDWFSSNFSFEVMDFPWVDNYNLTYDDTTTGLVHFDAVYYLTGITNWDWPDPTNNALISFTLRERSGFRNDLTDSLAGVDNVHVAPVPEPATMLLLGVGLVGIAGFGRKKFFKK